MVTNKIKIVNYFLIIISLALLTMSTTCKRNKDCPKDSHNKIIINNNSSKTINWRLFSIDSIYTLNGASYDEILYPNSSDNYSIRGETCWEDYFNSVNNGYEYFLIFDNDTVQVISWYAINGTNRGLLKRVKVDLNYLKANNFTISYP